MTITNDARDIALELRDAFVAAQREDVDAQRDLNRDGHTRASHLAAASRAGYARNAWISAKTRYDRALATCESLGVAIDW